MCILKRAASFFLLLFIPALTFAQSTFYYFKNYQVLNGLSSNTITAITQDKKGFMWFGTRNGLNRFDGNVFKIFQNKASDSTSIGSNSIFSLFEDEKEHLWVGTYKGIYLYDPLKENFTAFKGIPAGEVRFIKGDGRHHIWIVSNLTLYRYDELTGKIKEYQFSNDQTISINLSEKGDLWAATDKGLIKQYHAATDHFTDFEAAKYNKGKAISAIQDIYALGDTALLVGTMNQILRFNYQKRYLQNVFSGKRAATDIHTHVIFHHSGDDYWLGTESGLLIINSRSGKASLVQKQYSNPYSITDNIVSSIYRDKEGGIWAGTYFGGINYYSNQYNNFRKYFPEPGINSLSGNIVHEICKDGFGKLWVGTEDAGLNQVDLKTGRIRHFIPNGTPGSISYRNIHGLVVDGDKLWIGTYEHGLDVMNLRTNQVIKHYGAATDGRSFGSNFIVTLYRTKNSDILVGTWNGLFKYNRATDYFSILPFGYIHIQSIHEDENGTLWVSSYGSGVYFWNPQTEQKGHIAYQTGKAGGLINNYVNSLYEDSQKHFWFCTEAGLSQYDPKTRQFVNYTVENGLPANQVFRMLEDRAGNLWISTSKGLSSFNPKTRHFTSYHTANGLPTEQFNYNSSYKDAEGTMYFGTVKGMVSFRPESFIKNPFIPPVYITGIQVNNEELPIGGRSELTNSVTYTQNITLPYDASNISLDVAALSYIIPEMNHYAYKMDGADKNWVTLQNNRKIYYTKLPPGDYHFLVKGSNSEGAWNNKAIVLFIKILPPLWLTWWAYLFYTAIVVLIAIVIFRYYHLAVSEKNKRRIEMIQINTEREIYNAKIEFFTNVAHEIRTPLTLIKMPLDKLIHKRSADPEVEESLHIMKKNTNRLIDLTNQLLDFRKAEANKFSLSFAKTDINELLNEVAATFKPAADQKGINFKTETPRITLHAYADSEALRKILSNLINNAVKYAAHTVTIKLLPFSSEDTDFHIEIRNDGPIVPPEYKEKIFEPFFRMKETEKEAGTGIGLPLARSLALLHKGKLELKTGDHTYNVFLLSIPMHQETELHFSDSEENTAEIQQTTAEPEPNDNARTTILLVEDNKDILAYLQKELTAKYRVLKALNGQEALPVLQSENVQLVISDIMMPVMDGIELCKKMKSDLQYSHIPIILLTAKNSLNSKIEGLEVGADAYIEKPFSLEHLLAQMSNLLANRNVMRQYFAHSPLTHIKGMAVSKADKDFLEQLNKVIYENITDLDLDVDQLSAMMNMSRPTLYRKIKGISDMTPNELINLTRLKRGAELLAEGDHKINEVANLIGYSLPTNFSRDFQRQFGFSPSHYVNSLKPTDQ